MTTPPPTRESIWRGPVRRWASFIMVSAAIWAGYLWWRPPAPMLGLKHIEHLDPAGHEVAMTFDDAPHPLVTPLLLEALQRNEIKASFFCVGNNLVLYPELARRMVAEGHRLANHSQYHHNLTTVTPAEYTHEVRTCFDTIGQNGQTTRLFRPPGGGLNRSVMQYLYRRGVTLAWWSNNVGDYALPQAINIARQVNMTLRAGDILLLHDELTSTPKAIRMIAEAAKRKKLQWVPMPETAADAGSLTEPPQP